MPDEQYLESIRGYALSAFLSAVEGGDEDEDLHWGGPRRRSRPPSRADVEALFADPLNPYLDEEILAYPGIPVDLLERALQSEHEFLRLTALQNSDLPRRFVEEYLRYGTADQLRYLADNPSLTEEDLRLLARCSHDLVRSTVAYRHDLPLDLLHVFATDSAKEVRFVVSGRTETPAHLFSQLALDPYVHPSLSHNASVPGEVLASLDLSDERVESNLASNSSLLPETIEILSRSADPSVRAAVAARPDLPVHLARVLAEDPMVGVLHAVGVNPTTPTSILLDLPMALVALDCLIPHWDEIDQEAFKALAPTWAGSLSDLLEAIGLTGSSATRDVLGTLRA